MQTPLDPSVPNLDDAENQAFVSLAPAWLQGIGKLVDLSVILIGGALCVLIFINVVLHALSKDLAWLTEFGELLMVWVTFLGGAAAAQRGAHMCINEFLDKLGPEKRRAADLTVQGFSLFLLAIVFFYGLKIVASSWGNVLTTLEWPMAWQYMGLPIGSGLMMLFIAWDMVMIMRGVPREKRYPNEH